jgi:hypothetical protein
MQRMIETSRLRVFVATIEPTDVDGERHLWVAFRLAADVTARVCVSAVVIPPGEFPALVCWLETSDQYRRCGYGRELLQVLHDHYGALHGTAPHEAATDSGHQFLSSLEGNI